VRSFVDGVFAVDRDIKTYKATLRDFLIETLVRQRGDGNEGGQK